MYTVIGFFGKSILIDFFGKRDLPVGLLRLAFFGKA